MNPSYKVDFATFCHAGDIDRLYQPGQLELQVKSNGYDFNRVHVIHQGISEYHLALNTSFKAIGYVLEENMMDDILRMHGIDPHKPQYESSTDKMHYWKYHVVNHLWAVTHATGDYIVFADADCWMVRQPESWVAVGIDLLNNNPDIFLVSPNDGEPERKTLRMSQQMFMVRTGEFKHANFSQPGYTGNPTDYDTMPEYHAMLEGRMEYHCRATGKYRYVLGPEFRYFHHNVLTSDGYYDTDYKKLGWI